MPTTNYLPGVIVNTLDGGLTTAAAPQDDAILVIGTAGQGPVNTPYQVTDRALAAQTFGPAGSLERAIEECATYSDNILAFRIGTTPMQLTGVGLDTTVGTTTPASISPSTMSLQMQLPALVQGGCAQCVERRDTGLFEHRESIHRNDYVPFARRNINPPARAAQTPTLRAGSGSKSIYMRVSVFYPRGGHFRSEMTDCSIPPSQRSAFVPREDLPGPLKIVVF